MAVENNADYNDRLTKFQELFEDVCSEFLLDPKAITLLPVHITNCNGTGDWTFDEATIDYEKKPGFWTHLWYGSEYQAINEQLHGKMEFPTEAFQCLLECAFSDRHLKCLQLLLSTENYNEKTMKSILAIHYFCPLVSDCSYMVDSVVTCKCGEKPRQGQTSFGLKGYWHGNADIVLNESVVKVVKNPRDQVQCGNESDDDDDDNLISDEELLHQNNVTKISEVNLLKTVKKRAKSQAMAQAVVNSFYQARMKESLNNKYIPSFLATETYIRIILYNRQADTLLISDKYPIWETNEKGDSILNVQTLIQVWLTLNCQKSDENILPFICERTPCCNFRKVVGETVYSIYKTKVTRPLEQKEYGLKTYESALDLEGYIKATKYSSDLYQSIMGYKKRKVSTEIPDLNVIYPQKLK